MTAEEPLEEPMNAPFLKSTAVIVALLAMHSAAHMRRLVLRKVRTRPLGLFHYLWKNVLLEWAATKRRRAAAQPRSEAR